MSQQKIPVQLNQRQREQIQELSQKETGEIMDLLVKEKLPANLIDVRFQGWLKNALVHETYITMNAAYPEFKELFKAMHEKSVYDFNLREMGLALNCVEGKSMFQLCVATPDEYLKLQDAVVVMVVQWNDHADKLKKPILERYKKLAEMVANHKPIIMPNTKNYPLTC